MLYTIFSTVLQLRWQLLGGTLLVYLILVSIYRRFYHPLAQVPGPCLAAITKLYQTYYNRNYYKQIGYLHQKYGPIVRINPDEVHLSDPDYYDEIYCVGSKYSKEINYYDSTCVPESTFGTTSNEVRAPNCRCSLRGLGEAYSDQIHRMRRGAMNPMFSPKMVIELESVVQDKAQRLCMRMQAAIDKNEPCDLHHGFRSVSIDVISDFSFNRSFGLLESEDLGANFFRLTGGVGPSMWVFQQFPSIRRLAVRMPSWLATWLSEALGKVIELQGECVKQVEDVKMRLASGKNSERPTIFSTLLSPENKPDGYRIPSTLQLKDEAYSVLMAAADTTGNAMTVAAFYTMRDTNIYQQLTLELTQKFPHGDMELPFRELEKLPYLTAVIKEGLRLSFGVPGRLPRIVPEPGATFNGYFIPAGYIVGMSSWTMHRNPEVFPDPMKFDPSRWMDPARYRELEHHMVPFSRGSRQCVGMPLVYLTRLLRRFQEANKRLTES